MRKDGWARPLGGTEIVGPLLSLRLGLQPLDGQIDLRALYGDDDHLHILTLGQMLTDVADIGIGHLGDMYHAGLILRKCDKCAEIGDRLDFAF